MNDKERHEQSKFVQELCEHIQEEAVENGVAASIFYNYLFTWSALHMIKVGGYNRTEMNKLMKKIFDASENIEAMPS